MRISSPKLIILAGVLLAGAAGLTACGSNAALPGINPSLAIRAPADDSTVNLSAEGKIAIGFDTNYTIRAPGTCSGQNNCGHVYVLVDNSSCNSPNQPYNVLALASPVEADLRRCATPTGMHTITLELHHDAGAVVNNLVGSPVTDSVTITAQ
jgi:hypothetical protein